MFRPPELEKDEDRGPVYVREGGRLFLLGPRSSPRPPRSAGLFSRGFSVELRVRQEERCEPREKPFIFTYTAGGSLRYSAKPLFTLTLDLIAANLHHVDSLLGFPEQMAERLFTAAEARREFCRPHSGLLALRKFTEAYGELMASSLCLRGKYLLVSEKLEEIKSFRGLHSLDLSCCKLGDDHELLQHLTSCSLNSLSSLYLKDNKLSDVGLRRMTAPVRVLQRGLGRLTLLDLSCNPEVTEDGVKFLFVFKQLQFLDISDTGIRNSAATCQRIETVMGLLRAPGPLPQFQHTDCRTRGWTEQLWSQWDKHVASAAEPKESLKSRSAAQRFYGKEKPSLRHTEGAPHGPATECQPLQFHRVERGWEEAPPAPPHSGPPPVKRSPQDQSLNGPPAAPSAKRLRATAGDWDLLNSY